MPAPPPPKIVGSPGRTPVIPQQVSIPKIATAPRRVPPPSSPKPLPTPAKVVLQEPIIQESAPIIIRTQGPTLPSPVLKPILKTPQSPRKSPSNVVFGQNVTHEIPNKDMVARMAQGLPPRPVKKPTVATIKIVPTAPHKPQPSPRLTVTPALTVVSETPPTVVMPPPTGPLCFASGYIIVGDAEDIFKYFQQFKSWDQVKTQATERYQWTGLPGQSSLLMQTTNKCLRLNIVRDDNNHDKEIHLGGN